MMVGIAIWHSRYGLPYAETINRAKHISWIHEYNIALWNGISSERFLKNLAEELDMTKYDKEVVLSKLNEYIAQREQPTPFNYKIMQETKQFEID